MAMAMASATTTILPFNSLSFQTQPKFPSSQPLSLTHFNKHFNSTLKLSSSHCISSSQFFPTTEFPPFILLLHLLLLLSLFLPRKGTR
ncbi:50S ribosomal protein L35 chloroplastic [Bienertia sinuspersici]